MHHRTIENKKGSILAVDADPNSNLAEGLGLEVKESIGSIIDDIARHPEKIPAGMPKDRFIEYRIQTAISEADGFDVLSMGQPEGPGCYCYANNVLRGIMSNLLKEYDYIVIDNEAGLEHLSRRTTRNADVLLVVSEATAVGLKTAKNIARLVKELDIKTNKNFLLINRYAARIEKEKIEHIGLDYLGGIPFDEEIEKLSLNGASLWKLENEAISINALRNLAPGLIPTLP